MPKTDLVETSEKQEDNDQQITTYKGKIVYPVKSAAKAREQYLLKKNSNRKIVMPGKRRPQHRATRSARRR